MTINTSNDDKERIFDDVFSAYLCFLDPNPLPGPRYPSALLQLRRVSPQFLRSEDRSGARCADRRGVHLSSQGGAQRCSEACTSRRAAECVEGEEASDDRVEQDHHRIRRHESPARVPHSLLDRGGSGRAEQDIHHLRRPAVHLLFAENQRIHELAGVAETIPTSFT